MKTHKETLKTVKQFLENREGWNLQELINDITAETNLLKYMDIKQPLALDECGIEWDGEEICVLLEFIEKYTDIFLMMICNMLDSFIGEDLLYHEIINSITKEATP